MYVCVTIVCMLRRTNIYCLMHDRHNGEVYKKHRQDEIIYLGIDVCCGEYFGHDSHYRNFPKIHVFVNSPQDVELRDDVNNILIADCGQSRLTAGNKSVRSIFYLHIPSYGKPLTQNMLSMY